jgi:acyl dehydratase
MRNEMGYYFEDYIEGDLIVHSKSKTIFESDNNLFSLLTMNHHPVHINTQYALNSQHKEILVVGTLVFSLVVGLTVSDISGKAIANLSYDKIMHKKPVFIGDTIYARSKILNKKHSKTKENLGKIEIETIGSNQNERDVISFTRKILIKKKSL